MKSVHFLEQKLELNIVKQKGMNICAMRVPYESHKNLNMKNWWVPIGGPSPRESETQLSNEKNPGWLGYIGDEKLPSFLGIIINHYKL